MTPTASAAVRSDPSNPGSPSSPARAWATVALPIAVLGLAAFAWLYEGRGVTFFIDEWQWIIGRHSPSEASLLHPFNNHWMTVPIAIHQLLYRLVGIGSQVPYRVALLAVHLTTAWLLYTYLQRRVGRALALAGCAVFAFYGYAWTITMWPISLGWAIVTATAIGALLLVDRGTRRADIGASLLLLIGVASTSVAIAFVVGLAAELALRRAWRRVWIVIVPVFAYGVWFVAYGSGTSDYGSPGAMVRFIEKLLAQTAGTLLGTQARGTWANVTLGVVGLGFAALWFILGRPVTPRLVGLVVALGTYALVLAVARASFGVTSWYSYPSAVLVVLAFGELLRGRIAAPALTVLVIVVAAWAVAWNVGRMRDGGIELRAISRSERAELTATDLVRGRVAPTFKPENYFLRSVTAGAYFDVEDQFGTPAYSVAELQAAPRVARRAADDVLRRALKISPLVEGSTPVAAACETMAGPHVLAHTKGGIIFVQGATSVSIGMFDDGVQRLRSIGRGLTMHVTLPVLPGAPQWSLRVKAQGNVRVCTLPETGGS